MTFFFVKGRQSESRWRTHVIYWDYILLFKRILTLVLHITGLWHSLTFGKLYFISCYGTPWECVRENKHFDQGFQWKDIFIFICYAWHEKNNCVGFQMNIMSMMILLHFECFKLYQILSYLFCHLWTYHLFSYLFARQLTIKSKWCGCRTGRSWPQLSLFLKWCLMGYGTIRLIHTLHTSQPLESKFPAWSNTSAYLNQCFRSGVSVPLWCKCRIRICKIYKLNNIPLNFVEPSLPASERIKIVMGTFFWYFVSSLWGLDSSTTRKRLQHTPCLGKVLIFNRKKFDSCGWPPCSWSNITEVLLAHTIQDGLNIAKNIVDCHNSVCLTSFVTFRWWCFSAHVSNPLSNQM